MALAASACGADPDLSILHLNDLHARISPDHRGLGGFAYVKTALEEQRRQGPPTLTLHAGDMVQGTPVSTIFRGTPVYEIGNHLGIDLHCLGNHEFDYGWEQIRKFQEVSDVPILSANVLNSDGERLLPHSAVVEVGNLRVGVIGALTPRLPSLIKAELAGPWGARALVPTLRPIVADLRSRTDLVVVLGHLFDDEDEEILRELPDVDVLVSGHDHGGLEEALVVEGRIGVKLKPYGRELGRLDLWLDDESDGVSRHRWTRISVPSSRIEPDPATAASVAVWEERVAQQVDQPIGTCSRAMSRDDLVGLIERAMREQTGADIAYMNRGGVRDALPRGTVLARAIWNMLPFDNELVMATVRGRDIPAAARRRAEVDDGSTYRLVTNDFVAGQWRDAGISFQPTGHTLRDSFLEWVRERGQIP